MDTPIIQTNRLLLRPFLKTDAADVFVYASNPNVSLYTTWMTHRTIADSEAFIEMVLRRPENQHAWAIRLRQNSAVIGAIEFGLKNATEADFHYVLAEPFWHRGLMTEAAQSVVAWGRRTYPAVRRISSVAVKQNVASQRIMQKCGLLFQRYVFESWAKLSDPVELAEYALDCGSLG